MYDGNEQRNKCAGGTGLSAEMGESGDKDRDQKRDSGNSKTLAIGKCREASTPVHCTSISTFLWVGKLYKVSRTRTSSEIEITSSHLLEISKQMCLLECQNVVFYRAWQKKAQYLGYLR